MKEKKNLQVVVIFRRKQGKNSGFVYEADHMEIGYWDLDTHQFTNLHGEVFDYFLFADGQYGYGLRESLRDIKKKLPVNGSLKEYVRVGLKELRKYQYFMSVPKPGDYDHMSMVAYHKFKKNYRYMEEREIAYARKCLKKLGSSSFDVARLIEGIKEDVIGQDQAIEDIVTILWQNQLSDVKSNILLVGPTGVGKTEIIRSIAKRLDIPMAKLNVTDISETGYVGGCVTDCLTSLLLNANGDVEKASRGIVFLDEIDKKADRFTSGSISTTGVQDELLKLVEDNDYEINLGNSFSPNFVTLNTKNITFVAAGAFLDFTKSNKIGFGDKVRDGVLKKRDTLITSEFLVQYGLKKELVGRFPNIIELSSLGKEQFVQIMKNPNQQMIRDKINILNDLDIKTCIHEDVFELIAEETLERDLGVRGLAGVVDRLFIKAMGEISRNPNMYSELIIDKETVRDPSCYTLVKRKK